MPHVYAIYFALRHREIKFRWHGKRVSAYDFSLRSSWAMINHPHQAPIVMQYRNGEVVFPAR